VLGRVGWDVERLGLVGAPPLRVIAAAETHVTVFVALRYLGLGAPTTIVAADDQGRMIAGDLEQALEGDSTMPTIVCAQAGNVNTGGTDPLERIAAACRDAGAWLHVDGAFGLWAAAAPGRRAQVAGAALADSWATDGHKWLNVPYDCGIAITAHPEAHRAAMTMTAAYLVAGDGIRDGADWAPEASRRARAFTVWAALRSLGRNGIADLVERCCALTERIARRLEEDPDVEILNEVVLNQVLVRFRRPGGSDADAFTDAVIRRVQDDGVCWAGGTVWHAMHAMRISVSNWSTTEADIDVSADAILAARDASLEPLRR
jgi:glutamate/tyrosine decarboxylase-like PLP-dependent enzyme